MKMSDAVKKPADEAEPTLEDRVKALEAHQAFYHAGLLSFIGTLAYNDPYFGGTVVRQINEAVKARSESDAADIGG